MPSFVIVEAGRPGDAVLCDAGAGGYPDRCTDVPVKIRTASERQLFLNDEPAPRLILSNTRGNGTTTLLVSGTTQNIKDRQKRAALAKAASLLRDLAATIRPLTAHSKYPDFATSGLQMLFDWLSMERENLMYAGNFPSLVRERKRKISICLARAYDNDDTSPPNLRRAVHRALAGPRPGRRPANAGGRGGQV